MPGDEFCVESALEIKAVVGGDSVEVGGEACARGITVSGFVELEKDVLSSFFGLSYVAEEAPRKLNHAVTVFLVKLHKGLLISSLESKHQLHIGILLRVCLVFGHS